MSGQAAFQDVFSTATLASLYFDQGAYREAAEIYKKLLLKNPSDLESKMRLGQALSHMQGKPAMSKTPVETGRQDSARAWRISYLQAWLERIQTARRV